MGDYMTTLVLPYPTLTEGRFASIEAYTDNALFEATSVRIAFTKRFGGVSSGAYDSLNFGSHVDDDLACVLENRSRLLDALADVSCDLIVPNQVHGDTVLHVTSKDEVEPVSQEAAQGADALVVAEKRIAALLCFADCVPVIAVSPSGRFSVIHAGWRGVENGISAKAVRQLAEFDAQEQGISLEEAAAQINVYIGPYIHAECFETSPEIHALFVDKYTERCNWGERHIHLGEALRVQLERIGVDKKRMCDMDVCTVCNNEQFFSFRAQDGVAGRHGAFAVRM